MPLFMDTHTLPGPVTRVTLVTTTGALLDFPVTVSN